MRISESCKFCSKWMGGPVASAFYAPLSIASPANRQAIDMYVEDLPGKTLCVFDGVTGLLPKYPSLKTVTGVWSRVGTGNSSAKQT